jgi:putative zinc finger/helix-turn-helix YgiT family protein
MTNDPAKLAQEEKRCPVCGKGKLELRTITDRFEDVVDGEEKKFAVPDVPVEVCNVCGEIFYGPEAARKRHSYLCRELDIPTPEEIKSLRESLGLSQKEFADRTGLGIATISRWERGRLLPTREHRKLLRSLKDAPEQTLNMLTTPPPSDSAVTEVCYDMVVSLPGTGAAASESVTLRLSGKVASANREALHSFSERRGEIKEALSLLIGFDKEGSLAGFLETLKAIPDPAKRAAVIEECNRLVRLLLETA